MSAPTAVDMTDEKYQNHFYIAVKLLDTIQSSPWIHVDGVSVSENEGLPLVLFATQNHCHLLRGHRQDRQSDAVELVEAPPRSRLREALEDPAQTSVVHLGS